MTSLSRAFNIEDLRRIARARIPRAIFDFYDGGAEDEVTLRANRAAFERVQLLPRALVNVAEVDTRAALFGVESRFPLAIAPMGAVGAGRPGADLSLARAAKAYGIPYTLATPATTSIERVANEVGGRLWFQLYVLNDADFRRKLMERAHAAGYEALLVTVDVPVGGKRERDSRNDFTAPFRPTWRNSRDFWRKPAWVIDMLRNGIPRMENLDGFVQWSTRVTDAGAASVGRSQDASFDWEGLKRVRDIWPGKLLVKGIERADDAERLLAIGGDGLVVSNHGGRQLDGAAATLDALPAIAHAVGSRLTVLLDGGVRRGVDILKARALGAQAVLAGRAPLFGVMAAGEPGARRALEILTGEFERAMKLAGARTITEITPDLIRH
ncbi:MAG: alpha-hydroxy-acid oxidizing protein [Betaproteobacteria bacterium]|nr:alpha-hydroxy-acid oxidizing protein [Betaproteobacteria bacterium]